jgi:hypothetical protein
MVMQIAEYLDVKVEYERKMASALSELMKEFRERTGFSPRDIRVNLMETTKMEDRFREHRVESVNILVDL